MQCNHQKHGQDQQQRKDLTRLHDVESGSVRFYNSITILNPSSSSKINSLDDNLHCEDDCGRKHVSSRLTENLHLLLSFGFGFILALGIISGTSTFGKSNQTSQVRPDHSKQGHEIKKYGESNVVNAAVGRPQSHAYLASETATGSGSGGINLPDHLSFLIQDVVPPRLQQTNQSDPSSADSGTLDHKADVEADLPSTPTNESPTSPLIYLNNPEAASMLMSASGYNSHFFAYTTGLDVQLNQAYCAVASSVALLNSLRLTHNPEPTYFAKPNFLSTDGIDLPLDPLYDPYHYATQTDVFNFCTQQQVIFNVRSSITSTLIDRDMITMQMGGTYPVLPTMKESYSSNVEDGILTLPYGLSLKQTTALLICHLSQEEWDVEMHEADPSQTPYGEMKEIILKSLSNPNSRVLVNYHRTWLGQVGGGHFSPLGAYDPASDSMLIMDVAKYKYPPVWAKTSQLYHSLSTIDTCGDWDFPTAQENLPEELKHRPPGTTEEWDNAKAILGCRDTFRGVIVITRRD